ncbi:hypothetical protein B0H10DRAFT_1958052 [Mycena sp. CBHHK59/15]|nr:hypothetical protein B0H10DRAFT_1958052 [Mycena sp. CBHHK59/15]
MWTDVNTFYEFQQEKVMELSEKHSHTPKYIKMLLSANSQFKVTCKVNLHNTIIHDQALKAKATGRDHIVLLDLQEELTDDIEDGDSMVEVDVLQRFEVLHAQ